MEGVLIAILVCALIAEVINEIDSIFYPLIFWLDGAVVEIDEDSLSDYLDNSEYDWGHNVKNYMEDEL